MFTYAFIAGLFLAGCGEPVDPKGAALAAPWGEMRLPVGEGEVEEATVKQLHVSYQGIDSGDIPVVAAEWANALDRVGWEFGDHRKVARSLMTSAKRGDSQLSLIVSGIGKRVDVQLEIE